MSKPINEWPAWRRHLHTVIFEADTPMGKLFDVVLLIAIVISVLAACLESVDSIRVEYGVSLRTLEWVVTIAFTIEYILRLVCVGNPWRYARSFFGIVDLLSILPTYLTVLGLGSQSLIIIRALRLLRIFRIFKLARYVGEVNVLRTALIASGRKIVVFLGTVLTLILILGTVMYLVEGKDEGFDNIPQSVYWAIVTMTTVGYGDVTPETVLGRIVASIMMILGYAILAVPTGIVSVELGFAQRKVSTQACPECSSEGHDHNAKHCKFCGTEL
jgi:voltage-gated potassium channel